MRIDDLLEAVSGMLPDGWSVRIEVENGASWVAAVSPIGNVHNVDSDVAEIENLIYEAIAIAVEKTKQEDAE